MNKYTVIISEQAQQDLRDLSNTITFEYKSPVTAIKYLKGIYAQMRKLNSSAETYVAQTHKYFSQYGLTARRLNYKKMTIIYTVNNRKVYIQRVVPSSSITG